MSDLPGEFEVSVPEGASPVEEEALIDAERDRIVDEAIEKDLDDLLGGF